MPTVSSIANESLTARESAGQLAADVAIVTGAASGIGQEVSREFARQGASVVCADLNLEGAEVTATSIRDGGGEALAVRLDVTDVAQVTECISATLAEYRRVDILVNCAGINLPADPLAITKDQWRKVIAVNLDGPWNLIQAAMPTMMEQRSGKIINVASGAGLMGIPKAPHYTSSKHGLVGLTRALAADLGPFGITVNAICPGPVASPLLEATVNPVFVAEAIKRTPLGRLGNASDIAKAAVFLASDSADWITGVALPVDGGLLCCIRVRQWE